MRNWKTKTIVSVAAITLFGTGFAAPDDTERDETVDEAVTDAPEASTGIAGNGGGKPTTKRQKHANWIYKKAYRTCEKKLDTSAMHQAVVGIVFDVSSDGTFSVTTSFNQYMGSESTVSSLASCMASEANDGNRFPKGGDVFVGIKSNIARTGPEAPLKIRTLEAKTTRNASAISNWLMAAPSS